MTELTVERLFSAPDLNGPQPRALKFSPDGKQISWLQPADGDDERLDLWHYVIETGSTEMLVDSETLLVSRELSDEEKARRERKRIFNSGIIEYFWHPNSEAILFPLEGSLYLHHLGPDKTEQLTDDTTFETDVSFSPDGRYLAFVRRKNLYLLNLETGTEYAVTDDGGDTISNGLAEFIAQEEMHRFDGYWWSPDSQKIAFVRVDESPIDITHRFEIEADSFTIHEQRYPYTGGPNASIELGIATLDGHIEWLDLERDPDSYLARINWFRDASSLAVQIQSRDQQILDLVRAEPGNAPTRLLTETSESWINLQDHFRPLGPEGDFLWGSERSGFCHLYRLDKDGQVLNAVTEGDWVVRRVCHVDLQTRRVWFEGHLDTPLETHLYVTSLDQLESPLRLTRAGLSHAAAIGPGGIHFLDRYSGSAQPVSVDLFDATSGAVVERLSVNDLTDRHPMFPFIGSEDRFQFGTLHADDGQELHYSLLEPRQLEPGRRYPVILAVYGGPGVQRVTREWPGAWMHHMAARGYGILRLDNRGSSHRGKRFEAPIFGELGVHEVNDQLVGIDYLKTLDWVDPERIGAFGHSYGGYMTLLLMMKAPEVFQAGISVAPVVDWHLYDTHYTERYLGQPRDNTDGYRNSGVLPWVDGLRGKLLLIHGMADDNVLFTNSTMLMKSLQERNAAFDLMTYPGAKHAIAGRANNIHRYTMMDRFFDEHLGDRLK